ncbi:MAG: hypothetical protein AB7I27_18090 [Bacteriovoracaceae bacterium]
MKNFIVLALLISQTSVFAGGVDYQTYLKEKVSRMDLIYIQSLTVSISQDLNFAFPPKGEVCMNVGVIKHMLREAEAWKLFDDLAAYCENSAWKSRTKKVAEIFNNLDLTN